MIKKKKFLEFSLIILIFAIPVTNTLSDPPVTGSGMYFDGSASFIIVLVDGLPAVVIPFGFYDPSFTNVGPPFFDNTFYYFTDIVGAHWEDTPVLMSAIPPVGYIGEGETMIYPEPSGGISVFPSPTHTIKIAIHPDIVLASTVTILFNGFVLPDGSSLHVFICDSDGIDGRPDPDSNQIMLDSQEFLTPNEMYIPFYPDLIVNLDIFYCQWIVFEIDFPTISEFSHLIMPILLILPSISILIWKKK